MSKPWQRFKVGSPSLNPNWINDTYQPLEKVYHVAHIGFATRIVEDGQILAGLVQDKSRLNTERISVVWVSPNDWAGAGGFRYGNIRFAFNWKTLISGRNVYWVESIVHGVDACRILITQEDRSQLLESYDPEAGDGPWSIDAQGKHFWNGKYCLEIMVEANVNLESSDGVDFVTHHPKRCCIDPLRCRYRGLGPTEAGAEFLALLASRQRVIKVGGLTKPGPTGLKPTVHVVDAANLLLKRVTETPVETWGHLLSSDAASGAIGRSLLGALAVDGFVSDRTSLVSIFTSRDHAERAVANALAEALGLRNGDAFLE